MISKFFGFTDSSGSMRKTLVGFSRVEWRTKASSIAVRPSFKYCSNWSLEINWEAPTVSKVPVPPSEGNDSTFRLTPVRDSIVLRYSRRFSLRMVILPPESESFFRASTMVCARSSRKSAFSSFFGCRFFSGGISPAFMALSTFCHNSACSRVVTLNDRASRLTFPFCVSPS